MQAPQMLESRALDPSTVVLPSVLPVPGAGLLPVNAFVLRAEQPLLVDAGLSAVRDDFVRALGNVLDPAELRWIWITHTDPDHVGSLRAVLKLAPQAKVVTNFLGMGKMGLLDLPTDRVHLLNPGQSLDLGDRRILALTPPVYDAPETMAAFDPSTRSLFSADSFGAMLDRAYSDVGEIDRQVLREGLLGWSRVDAPWLADVEPAAFGRSLGRVQALGVERILSAHLPPASGITTRILDVLTHAPTRDAFVGPDQAAFEELLAATSA